MLLKNVKAKQSGVEVDDDGTNNYKKLMSLMMQLRKWSGFCLGWLYLDRSISS